MSRAEDQTTELSRAELQLRIMKNIERSITEYGYGSHVAQERRSYPNWVLVQKYLTSGTSKGGSTSAHIQCRFMGIDPDGKTFL